MKARLWGWRGSTGEGAVTDGNHVLLLLLLMMMVMWLLMLVLLLWLLLCLLVLVLLMLCLLSRVSVHRTVRHVE
jgi:hypothetical protein